LRRPWSLAGGAARHRRSFSPVAHTGRVLVEHANSEVIGIHASRSANRFEALEPVRQGVHRCFGAIAPGVARGLKLRHDHGSNYMSVAASIWTLPRSLMARLRQQCM
jgi:hypothetical protein